MKARVRRIKALKKKISDLQECLSEVEEQLFREKRRCTHGGKTRTFDFHVLGLVLIICDICDQQIGCKNKEVEEPWPGLA